MAFPTLLMSLMIIFALTYAEAAYKETKKQSVCGKLTLRLRDVPQAQPTLSSGQWGQWVFIKFAQQSDEPHGRAPCRQSGPRAFGTMRVRWETSSSAPNSDE